MKLLEELLEIVGSSAKYVVSGTTAVVIIANNSWIPLYYISAAVGNAVFGKVIKSIIRQPRPSNSPKSGYGMPSSHAQSLFFFFSATSLKLLQHDRDFKTWMGIAFGGLYSTSASWWRIKTSLHDFPQTLVGAGLGIGSAILSFSLETRCIESIKSIFGEKSPIWLRFLLVASGAVVLYRHEMKFFFDDDKKK